MNIVLTGSESFIGQELKRHCTERGIGLTGIDAVPSQDPGHTVMDIRSPDIASAIPSGTDALVHLAAISRDGDCRAEPHLALDVNTLGTLNLYLAACRQGVRQFIFASSEWVYGEVAKDAAQVEDQAIDVTRMQSVYALSKVAAEQSLRLAHQQESVPVTVLRFGIVYGPRTSNWSAVESLFNSVRTQDAVSVGSLATARRFIHVSDISTGILAALGTSGFEVLNLSGDTLVTLGEVIHESAEILGRSPEVSETAPESASVRNPDNAKARRVLGWAPALDIRAGLETLVSTVGAPEETGAGR